MKEFSRNVVIRVLFFFTVSVCFAAVFFVVHAETVDVSVSVQLFECSDGIDNDFDGLIDFPNDLGCTDGGDDDETNSQCNDSLDNDTDGLIDFPDDPGCNGLQDDDETDSVFPSNSGGGVSSRPVGLVVPQATSVVFTGLAHPGSHVVLLKDAVVVGDATASPDATFRIGLSGVSAGNHVFSMHGTDTDGIRSGLISFNVEIPESFLVEISDIFIPPTIYVESDAADNNKITVFGQTVPSAAVTMAVFFGGTEQKRYTVTADTLGQYSRTLVDPIFKSRDVPVKSFAAFQDIVSAFGLAAVVSSAPENAFLLGDFNTDRHIDLVDFSMLAFWYKRSNVQTKFDLNNDGVVNLIDMSIMASNWTG